MPSREHNIKMDLEIHGVRLLIGFIWLRTGSREHGNELKDQFTVVNLRVP
jgi:hypothetical protein